MTSMESVNLNVTQRDTEIATLRHKGSWHGETGQAFENTLVCLASSHTTSNLRKTW